MIVKGVLLKWPVDRTKFERLNITLGVRFEFQTKFLKNRTNPNSYQKFEIQ